MKRFSQYFILFVTVIVSALSPEIFAKTFSQTLCDNPAYHCEKIEKGETWVKKFPDESFRNIVMRANRMNIPLRKGMTIAVPINPAITVEEINPFESEITPPGKKTIIVDPKKMAWVAYAADGKLVAWGPASLGKDYCRDVNRGCRTITGYYTIVRKGGVKCISSKYPLPKGGAPMPYCMHFFRGYALHGSYEVPGYHASHGCIRLFVDDAKWLNQEFAEPGTKIIVKSYNG